MKNLFYFSAKKQRKISKLLSFFLSTLLVLQSFLPYTPALLSWLSPKTVLAEENSVELNEPGEETSEEKESEEPAPEDFLLVEEDNVSEDGLNQEMVDEEEKENSLPAEDKLSNNQSLAMDLVEPIEPPESAKLQENVEPEEVLVEEEEIVEKVCLTDEQIKDSVNEDWEVNLDEGWAQTRKPVKLGIKYLFPQENKASVTFNCLPADESLRTSLKIQQVKVADLKLPEDVKPVGEFAYDITTGMNNGDFEHDVTLPKLEGQEAEVSYIEKSYEELSRQTQVLKEDELKEIDQSQVSQENDKVKVSDLDHLSIWIATVKFTDSNSEIFTLLNGDKKIILNEKGALVEASLKVGAFLDSWKGTGWKLGSGSWQCVDTPDHSAILSEFVEKFNITAQNSFTTEDVFFRIYNNNNCTGNYSAKTTILDAITVVETKTNPALTQSCGLDIALVLDNSNSVSNISLNQMKAAFINMVNSLSGTPTQFSVIKFGSSASVLQAFTSNTADVISAINSVSVGGGATNWKDALLKAKNTFDPRLDKANLIIFSSDGNPTYPDCGGSISCAADLESAVSEANAAKLSSVRILTLGIGSDLSIGSLKFISGPNLNTGDFLTSDVVTTDFNSLADQLAVFASQTCGGTITVNKYINQVDVSSRGGAGWVYNIAGTTETTDANGQTNPASVSAGTNYTVTESNMLSGYSYGSASCKNQAGVSIGSVIANGVGSITIGNTDIISCDFVNISNPTFGGIRACKFKDLDGDGTWIGDNEPMLSGWNMRVAGNDWQPTGDDGCVDFNGLTPGSYTVEEEIQNGWVNTTNNNPYQADVRGNILTIVYFGNQESVVCGNGVVEDGEQCDYGILNGQSLCSSSCEWVYVCEPEQNVVANGSFEIPSVTHSKKWDIFPSAEVPGWQIDWYGGSSSYGGQDRPEQALLELHRGVNGWVANEGEQYAELDTDWVGPDGSLNNEPASVKISQQIPTYDGYKYQVSFAFRPRPNTGTENNQLRFEWGSYSEDISPSESDWKIYTYEFTADSSLTTLSFTDLGTPDSLGTFLDNVSVVCLGEEVVCEEGSGWANNVVSFDQGTTKNGGSIAVNRSDPSDALGVPDSPQPDINFVSLGLNGVLVLSFNAYVLNVGGNDLSFHEVTWGRNGYPVEKMKIEVSQNGIDWYGSWEVTNKDGGDGIGYVDFNSTGLGWVRYVRLTDTTDFSLHNSANADGFDLDAVDYTNGVCDEPQYGSVTIVKDVVPNDSSVWDFVLAGPGDFAYGYMDLPDEGSHTWSNLTPGSYNLSESVSPDYSTSVECSNQASSDNETVGFDLGAGEDITCTFTNQHKLVKLKAQKVVCDTEADLPNWGNGGPNVNADTAQTWVNTHPNCHLEDQWQFQWSGAGGGSFGAFQTDTSLLGDSWQTFIANQVVEISDTSNLGGRIELREVFSDSYPDLVGFSNDSTNNISAEFYCASDVYNYDNWEWINSPSYGETYYCVAFNAPNYGSISGHKWEDKNVNGVFDGSDEYLENWMIKLWNGVGQGPVATPPLDLPDQTRLTDSNGEYVFEDLPFGDYTICEEQQSGWQQYLPGDNICCALTVNDNGKSSFCEFANYQLGMIQGRKYNDVNGNGDFDSEEKTALGNPNRLDDWHIYLYDENWDLVDEMNTGDDNTPAGNVGKGQYRFVNLPLDNYYVCEEDKTNDGWFQTEPVTLETDPNTGLNCFTARINRSGRKRTGLQFGNFKLGEVKGYKYEDVNGSGDREEGELGLDNWTMVLGNPEMTTQVSVDPSSSTAVDLGTWESGVYYFVKVNSTYGAGDLITADAECSSRDGSAWNTVVKNYESYGESLLDLEIDNLSTDWGFCHANHVYTKVFLGDGNSHSALINDIYRPNNTGSLNVEVYKMSNHQTTLTSGGGYYQFTGINAGDYALCEVQQDNWGQTEPQLESSGGCYLFSASSEYAGDYDFGNKVSVGNLKVCKFNDLNGNGQWEEEGENDPFIAWDVEVSGQNGATRGDDGCYTWTDLPVNSYTVSEAEQDGWVQTSYNSPSVVGVNSGETTAIYFGNFQYGRIGGYKFNDLNANGIWDEGEDPLNDWEICLTWPQENGLTDVKRFGEWTIIGDPQEEENKICVNTGEGDWADGYYEFIKLQPNTYTVAETLKSDWTQTKPIDPNTYSVLIQSGTGWGEEAANYDFGNYADPSLLLTKTNDAKDGGKVLSSGDLVEFTVTVENTGNGKASNVEVVDSQPIADYFEYQTSSGTLSCTDETDSTLSSSASNPYIWGLGDMEPGEICTLKYKIEILSTNIPGEHSNLAFARALGGDEGMVYSNTVIDPFDVGYKRDLSAGVTSTGEVLGAASGEVLGAATGSRTEWFLAALLMILSGIALKLFERRKMKKILRLLFLFILPIALYQAPVVLGADSIDPAVAIVQLPEYLNKRDFEISYTALDAGGSGLKDVKVEYKKEGDSWQSIGTYTDLARKIDINNGKINDDKKYYFKATACDNAANCTSSETFTNIDTSGPPKPENFSKEKTGVQSYKIKWHNPDNDDIYQVYVYRSDEKDFNADNGTEVARVNVTKNTDSEWNDAVVPDGSKEYYYVIRSVDRAGNGSDLVGDLNIVYEEGLVGGETTTGQEELAGQEAVIQSGAGLFDEGSGGQILGKETDEASDEATMSASAKAETEDKKDNEEASGSKKPWFLIIGGGVLLAVAAWWFFIKKEK